MGGSGGDGNGGGNVGVGGGISGGDGGASAEATGVMGGRGCADPVLTYCDGWHLGIYGGF